MNRNPLKDQSQTVRRLHPLLPALVQQKNRAGHKRCAVSSNKDFLLQPLSSLRGSMNHRF